MTHTQLHVHVQKFNVKIHICVQNFLYIFNYILTKSGATRDTGMSP